jgi:hypothetical protein
MLAGQLTLTHYHVTPDPRREKSHTTHAPTWSVPTFIGNTQAYSAPENTSCG